MILSDGRGENKRPSFLCQLGSYPPLPVPYHYLPILSSIYRPARTIAPQPPESLHRHRTAVLLCSDIQFHPSHPACCPSDSAPIAFVPHHLFPSAHRHHHRHRPRSRPRRPPPSPSSRQPARHPSCGHTPGSRMQQTPRINQPPEADIPGIYSSQHVSLDVPALDGRPPAVKYAFALLPHPLPYPAEVLMHAPDLYPPTTPPYDTISAQHRPRDASRCSPNTSTPLLFSR